MRQKIINARLAGQTLQQIAAWVQPPVSEAAICRFFQKAVATTQGAIEAAKTAIANNGSDLTDPDSPDSQVAIRAATRAALAVAVDPFLTQMAKSNARRERWIESAEAEPEGPNHRALAAHDRNDLTALELHAKLAGRLDAQPSASSNTFVLIPVFQVPAQPAPAPIEAEWTEITPDDPSNNV